MEEQLTDMSEKVHKLKNLGYEFKDATIAVTPYKLLGQLSDIPNLN